LSKPQVPLTIHVGVMEIEDRILSSRRNGSHPPAGLYMNAAVRTLNDAVGGESGRDANGRGIEGADAAIHGGVAIGGVKFTRGVAERSRKSEFRTGGPVPVRESPARLAGEFADN